mmetsp:Transcript_34039/g.78551  ORF Transcript_34039/g.78551 Transcript_34039/m.78551 type:complete len:500 (-) Transcript_34039:747-2246(-)
MNANKSVSDQVPDEEQLKKRPRSPFDFGRPAARTCTAPACTAPLPIKCPYLDTINRAVLDFDFEKLCSSTLASAHVYGCLVCGRFFAGRGKDTEAYVHSVDAGHNVFVELSTGRFYCLPDGYEVVDGGLDDIREALDPRFGFVEDIVRRKSSSDGINNSSRQRQLRIGAALDDSCALSRDLFGRRYLPGYVGLNNLGKTDYINVSMQALAHVPPIRDFFLLTSRNGSREARWSPLALRFGELMRKMWSDRRFKSNVDPHEMVQAISTASKKRFHINKRADVSDFLSWFLNNLHLGIGGSKKPNSSIVHRTFQGIVEVTARQRKKKKVVDGKMLAGARGDDRLGSDDEEEERVDRRESSRSFGNADNDAIEIEETTDRTRFLTLTFDIPEKPLFKDDTQGGVVIPQEPLFNILKKFDGISFNDASYRGVPQRRRYRLQTLPDYLILALKRFKKNNFATEKNPTIVTFPVKNLDLDKYVFDKKPKGNMPSEEVIKNMSVSK